MDPQPSTSSGGDSASKRRRTGEAEDGASLNDHP